MVDIGAVHIYTLYIYNGSGSAEFTSSIKEFECGLVRYKEKV